MYVSQDYVCVSESSASWEEFIYISKWQAYSVQEKLWRFQELAGKS